MAANIAELRKQSSLPANKMGGSNVSAFFEANKSAIAAVLPKHVTPERLMKIAMHAIRTTPALQECSVKSLLGAVIQSSQLGLEPNTILGHAYLVPYKNRKSGTTDAQFIPGYKGLIDLARRSGQIESIAAHAVHAADEFEFSYGLHESLTHKPAMTGDRGDIIAFYAIAKLKGGGHAFEVMPRSDVDAVMRSTQSKGQWGPWKDHYPEMGRKTVIRRLAKYLPLSIEFATAAALDGQAEAGEQNMASVLDGDFVVMDQAEMMESVDEATGEITAAE
jgi:recombination protein RecT